MYNFRRACDAVFTLDRVLPSHIKPLFFHYFTESKASLLPFTIIHDKSMKSTKKFSY